LMSFPGNRVPALMCVANSERFFAMWRSRGLAVVPPAFAHNHRITPHDFDLGSDLPVLMTVKHAVKCTGFANDRTFSVPISAQLPEAFWIALLDSIRKPHA